MAFGRRTSDGTGRDERMVDAVRRASFPLGSPDELDPLLEHIGEARYVLLGESSHGTSEFYIWRAALTKRLIAEKQFSFVGVEGDCAIGVVYAPAREAWGNYVPSIVSRRYDALVHIDESRAVDALHMPVKVDGEAMETWPSGM